jgi:hypothetical protein
MEDCEMRSTKIGGRGPALASLILAVAALAAPLPAGAAHVHVAKPTVLTGSATHILPTSALLAGVVNPKGAETSYYFQWGPSTAGPTITYAAQTPTVAAGTGEKRKVGQPISGLQPGVQYHFRLVAIYSGSAIPVIGADRTFTAKGNAQRLELVKPPTIVAGSPFVLSGVLRGTGNAGHAIVLQASPYPYLEPFVNLGTPATTNATGLFSFRVNNLSSSTQFRVVTIGALPVYSPVITVSVALRVTLHMHSGGAGLVRLYGTVTPAVTGARVLIQRLKSVRPSGTAEEGSKFVRQFTTVTKRGSKSFSRFSVVVKIRHAGRYRAFVVVKPGEHVSGASPTLGLKASK